MHLPDGLMDPIVAATGWLEFVIAFAVVLFLGRSRIREKSLPRVAILAAGIFVAQMLNFPVGGGTTGHLIGAALFAIMVGPTLAIIGMTVVLLIQALMFGDGGVTAFGLNALNMAIIAPLVGWGAFTLMESVIGGRSGIGRAVSVAVASWASVFIAAAACASELFISYAVSSGAYGIAAGISIPAMLGYHAVIGIGEAAITVGLVTYLTNVSPDMFSTHGASLKTKTRVSWLTSDLSKATAAILLVFMLMIPLYILYSSKGLDGLEQTMADSDMEEGSPLLHAPFSYGESFLEILFAGILGFLAVSLAAVGIQKVLRNQKEGTDPE